MPVYIENVAYIISSVKSTLEVAHIHYFSFLPFKLQWRTH